LAYISAATSIYVIFPESYRIR